MDLTTLGLEGVDWMHLALRAPVNTVIHFQVPKKWQGILDFFSGFSRTRLFGVFCQISCIKTQSTLS